MTWSIQLITVSKLTIRYILPLLADMPPNNSHLRVSWLAKPASEISLTASTTVALTNIITVMRLDAWGTPHGSMRPKALIWSAGTRRAQLAGVRHVLHHALIIDFWRDTVLFNHSFFRFFDEPHSRCPSHVYPKHQRDYFMHFDGYLRSWVLIFWIFGPMTCFNRWIHFV